VPATGAFSCEDDVRRSGAALEETLVRRERVVDCCRVRVFGGEAVVDGDGLGVDPSADFGLVACIPGSSGASMKSES